MDPTSIDPEWFLRKFRLQFMATELKDDRGNQYAYEARFRREGDKSTISFVMRTKERPTLLQAIGELHWLFITTSQDARTWNRLAEFFTEEEIAMLKAPKNGLDAVATSQ